MSSSGDRRRWAVRGFALLLLALVALIAIAVVLRREIAEFALVGELRRRVGDDAGARVGRLDRDGLELSELRVGDALEVARVVAHYSLAGLARSRLDAVEVSGLRLRGRIDDSGISFGALDALRATGGSGGPDFALPTLRIGFDDARIELATPQGLLSAALESQIRQVDPASLEATASLHLEHELARLDAALRGEGDAAAFSGRVGFEAAASGDLAAALGFDELRASANPSFTWRNERLAIGLDDCAKLRIDGLARSGGPRLNGPVEICARTPSDEPIFVDADGRAGLHLLTSLDPISLDWGNGWELDAQLPQVELRAARGSDAAVSGSLLAESGQIELPGRIRARGFRLAATSETALEFGIDRLSDPLRPERFAALGVVGKLEAPDGGPIGFDIEIADAARSAVVEITGRHDPDLANGSASVQMVPFVFCPGGPRLEAVVPALRGVLRKSRGSIEASGSAAWDADTTHVALDVAVRDLSATTAMLEFEHLYAAVALSESGTPPGQMLSIGRIDFGLELTNGEILFQIRPDGILAIESAVWEFAGGLLSLAGEFDPQSDRQSLAFDVKGVELADLLERIAFDGLSGSGTLDGRLPVERDGDRIEIRGARLVSTPAGGTIRYRPEGAAAGVGAAKSQFAVVLGVLEDFHFTHLSLQVDGDAAAEVVVKIRIEGSNPNYEGGRAVHFNLSIDSRLADLVSSEGSAYQIPYTIEERFRSFPGSRVNPPPSPCVNTE